MIGVRAWPFNRILSTAVIVTTVVGLLSISNAHAGGQVLDLRFNGFALISALTFLLNIGLAIYLVQQRSRSYEHLWLNFYLASLSVYAFGEMMQRFSATPYGAQFWFTLSNVGIGGAGAIYLFALAYTNKAQRLFSGTTVALLMTGAFVTFFFSFTDAMWPRDASLMTAHPWGFDFDKPNAGLNFTSLYFAGLLLLAIVLLVNFMRRTRSPILRRQSLLFIVAIGFPIVGGIITDSILPSAGFHIPKLAMALATPSAFLLIFAAMRYRLLTISPTLFANTILAIMGDMVVAVDTAFNIVYINARAEALLGLKADATDTQSLLPHVAERSRQAFQDAFAVDDQTHTITVKRLDIVRPGHPDVPVTMNASRFALTDAQQTWVMAFTDISAEIQTQSVIEHEVTVRTRELHEARAYLVSSITSLQQGFVLVNAKAQVELLNDRARVLLKLPEVDLTTQPIAKIVQAEGWSVDLAKAIERILTTHRSRHLAVSSSDGSFYEVYLTAVLSGKQLLGATVVIQDVTEQKILDRSKEEFFSIASHELRTPLTAIRGNMSMAKDYFASALKDATLHGLIDDSHEASVRLIEIVNDFLDSSRLEQGKMVFTIEPVALEPLVSAVCADLKLLSEQNHDQFRLEGLSSLPQVMADAGRLRQILYNLISNAVKYGEQSSITISGDHDNEVVRIRIIDTGKGISPEGQKMLFRKFQQAGESILTRDNTKGTGLGLYIARLLATNMHGTVELEHSEEGKGSTFVITLPLAKPHSAQSANGRIKS